MPAVPVTAAVSTGGQQEAGLALQPCGSDSEYREWPPFFPSSHRIHPGPGSTPHTQVLFSSHILCSFSFSLLPKGMLLSCYSSLCPAPLRNTVVADTAYPHRAGTVDT